MLSSFKDKIAAKLPGQDALKEKMDGALNGVVAEHKDEIAAFMRDKIGASASAAAQDDDKMRTLAKYMYALLPGVVRLAVKEDAFTDFVLQHRSTIMSKIGG